MKLASLDDTGYNATVSAMNKAVSNADRVADESPLT